MRTTLSLSSSYPQPTLRLPLSLPSAYPQPTLSSPRAAAPGEPAASGGQSAGRLDNLQPYYLRLVDDGTPELKIIRAMCAMGALKLVSSKEGGNEYEAAADIQPNTPLLVYGGKLCDVGASPSEHARYVKELEYKLTYIDGYPYDADGKTILLPETHHGSLLNEPKNGQASACFKDIHPCALNRGPYVRGLLPPLKIVCAGSKGIATGQKVTVKYAPWGGVSGVAHQHRASAASQSSSSTTHTAGELDADAAGESTAAAIEPAAVVNVGGCGHCPSPTLPSPCFHCCYHGNNAQHLHHHPGPPPEPFPFERPALSTASATQPTPTPSLPSAPLIPHPALTLLSLLLPRQRQKWTASRLLPLLPPNGMSWSRM